ncbi:MAG: hypothetical protein HXX08_17755 [Chloroflexi bacterium]|uniref:Histidine kinase N-terminal 7TM region domain-containing protein n=1 Tax=Candidatus Chlorohelix allophototropha TaxID=3003348 RepID=A0A8T7M6W9_9CHLR|nr:hypothetical protein [Chloroflexota bacterium]WJW69607.1 hypothetical protein OZ401_003234 [Chloroflexota bacterium L227-S17]
MFNIDLQLIFTLVGFGAFLWMGLYMISRISGHSNLTLTCFFGMLTQAYFFVQTILVNFGSGGRDLGLLVHRTGWWSNVIPLVFWFHISSLVVRRGPKRTLFTPAVIAMYIIGITISLLGSFTDFLLNLSSPVVFSDGRIFVDVGSYYEIYIFFVLLAGGGAFLNFMGYYLRIRNSPEPFLISLKMHISLLTSGAFMFFAGGLFLALRFKFNFDVPGYPGYLALVLGLGLCSYSVINFEMLVAGKRAQRDFIYSFSGIFLINLFYTIPLVLLGVSSPIILVVLIGIVTTTHTIFDFGRSLMDRLFFTKIEQDARKEARDYATFLITQPVATEEMQILDKNIVVAENNSENNSDEEIGEFGSVKSFNNMVRRAITALKSPPQLVKSPLLSLAQVENRLKRDSLVDNRLNRAAVLKSILTEMIEHLRPAGNLTYGTTDTWRFFNVLFFPYVREISKKQAFAEARHLADERRKSGVTEKSEMEKALEWLSDIEEDTFYKWQRRASDTIAESLREEETVLRSQPVSSSIVR